MDDLAGRSGLESEFSPAREGGARPGAVWARVLVGTLAAVGVAWAACWVPVPLKTSGLMIFLRALITVLFTAQAGFVAVMAWQGWMGSSAVSSWRLSLQVGFGWVFIPCIALFYRQRSLWMLALTVVVSGILAVRVRGLFGAEVETVSVGGVRVGGVPAFAELPVEREGWWRTPVISLCAQMSLFPILAGEFLIAAVLLAVGSALLAWRWSAGLLRLGKRDESERAAVWRLIVTTMVAIFILWRALTPWIVSGAGSVKNAGNAGRRGSMFAGAPKDETGFVGIILLPPPQKKAKMIAPAPEDYMARAGRAAEPVVIPFDGPYWYFKAPFREPGARAHVVHGKPTLVNIRSTDFYPLMMEAHQSLGTPMDLSCCREIEVAITNGDNRVGGIGIGVLLTDTSVAGRPSQDLGVRPIVSSEAAEIALNRAPVNEVLRFPIGQPGKIHRFDAITVVFLPAKERARGGAKVSIQSFRLIPR